MTQALRAASRHSTLARLLLHTGDQEQALEIWEALGRGTIVEAGADPVGPTVALLGGSLREQLALPALPPELLLRRSVWVLELHPARAASIFLDPRNTVPTEDVVRHLEAVCGPSSPLVVRFLEAYLERRRPTAGGGSSGG